MWIRPEDDLPPMYESVLAIVNGREEHCTYENAPVIAEFWPDGWYTDEIPHGNFTVAAWMEIPEFGDNP